MDCLKNKTDVALFVEEELSRLKPNSALTMIITPEKSGEFYVRSVTGMSLEDTVEALGQIYFLKLTST